MNKLTLAMNAWRAYSAARKAEGSSLRGKIIAGVSVAAVAAITLLRGDLTADDVSAITTGMFGLDVVLKYFIPDQLGQRQTDDLSRPLTLSQKARRFALIMTLAFALATGILILTACHNAPCGRPSITPTRLPIKRLPTNMSNPDSMVESVGIRCEWRY